MLIHRDRLCQVNKQQIYSLTVFYNVQNVFKIKSGTFIWENIVLKIKNQQGPQPCMLEDIRELMRYSI